MVILTELIYKALSRSPLLISGCTGAEVFDRSGLPEGVPEGALSFEQKLGHLYEDGLARLLEASTRYELLEQGLQVQSDKHHTVGELDFLVRDLEGRELVHLELAVKFYLALRSESGEMLMPGPDARDNYYKKLEHLQGHQLTVASRYQSYLPEAYRQEVIHSRYLVIGCLFDHISELSPVVPVGVSASVRRGVWLHQSEFAAHFSVGVRVTVIPKPLWPVPIEELEVLPDGELETLDLKVPLNRCVMVRVEGERKPIFIAPDNYPAMDKV